MRIILAHLIPPQCPQSTTLVWENRKAVRRDLPLMSSPFGLKDGSKLNVGGRTNPLLSGMETSVSSRWCVILGKAMRDISLNGLEAKLVILKRLLMHENRFCWCSRLKRRIPGFSKKIKNKGEIPQICQIAYHPQFVLSLAQVVFCNKSGVSKY